MLEQNQFDLELTRLRQLISDSQARAEECTGQFSVECVSFCEHWIKSVVETAVVLNPDVAKIKGINGLRALKEDLRHLLGELPQIVKSELARDGVWPHRAPASMGDNDLTSGGKQPPNNRDQLYEAVQRILGHTVDLFEKHNLPDNDVREFTGKGARKQYLPWSSQLHAVYEKYHRELSDSFRFRKELAKMVKEKEHREAEDLWRNA